MRLQISVEFLGVILPFGSIAHIHSLSSGLNELHIGIIQQSFSYILLISFRNISPKLEALSPPPIWSWYTYAPIQYPVLFCWRLHQVTHLFWQSVFIAFSWSCMYLGVLVIEISGYLSAPLPPIFLQGPETERVCFSLNISLTLYNLYSCISWYFVSSQCRCVWNRPKWDVEFTITSQNENLTPV